MTIAGVRLCTMTMVGVHRTSCLMMPYVVKGCSYGVYRTMWYGRILEEPLALACTVLSFYNVVLCLLLQWPYVDALFFTVQFPLPPYNGFKTPYVLHVTLQIWDL
jgi:hypothetical protein